MGKKIQLAEEVFKVIAYTIFFGIAGFILLIMIGSMVDGMMRGGGAADPVLASRIASETAAQTVRAMQSAGGGGAWAANAALAGTVVAFAGLSGIRRA